MAAGWQKLLGGLLLFFAGTVFANEVTLPMPVLPKPQPITAPVVSHAVTSTTLDKYAQTLAAYQQQTNLRIVQLQQQSSAMQEEIIQLNTMISVLKQQYNHLNALRTSESPNNLAPNNTSPVLKNIFTQHKVAIWVILLSSILIAWIWLPNEKPKQPEVRQEPIVKSDDDEDEQEYDFMNSLEAIPAKLDLARAYIEMEDFAAAKQVLQEILSQGNSKEKQQAQTLIEKLAL